MDLAELGRRFTHHPPTADQPERYVRIRAEALELASTIVETTPESREQSLAITALEETVFWANAAIARREPRGIPDAEPGAHLLDEPKPGGDMWPGPGGYEKQTGGGR